MSASKFDAVEYRVSHMWSEPLFVSNAIRVGGQPRTDFTWMWRRDDGGLDALVVDTNNVEPDCAESVAAHLADVVRAESSAGGPLADCFVAGRRAALEDPALAPTPSEARWVNAACLRMRGAVVELVGAYAPLYVIKGDAVEQYIFEGTVLGVPDIAHDFEPQLVEIEAGAIGLVLSDGMLESRNAQNKINGDSLLYRHAAEISADLPRSLDVVLELYAENDVQSVDSHGVLAIRGALT